MRTSLYSIWLAFVLFTCNSRAAVTPAPTSSPTPTIVDKIADPRQAQGREQNIEYSSRAYAVAIDYLSIKLGQLLGPWSLQDLFWQITPAKMIAGTIAALITLIFWQILRLILHRAASQPRSENTTHFWIRGILRSLRKALVPFCWTTALLLLVSPLLPHLAIGFRAQAVFTVVSRLAALGYTAALIIFAYHSVRLLNTWLTTRSHRQPRRWYDPVFPFLGRLVHYNFVLLATQWLLYALQLPTNYQAVTSKFIAIVTAIVNCVMLIQMVHATETVMIARSQSRLRDPYKFRNVQTRLRILRQLSVFLVLIFSAAAVLVNIDAVRQIGTGLLASAGVAGVIVGFAAQKSLTTIIAGLQVAVTNPMKIDDVVFVESEYGTIEEITLTYVVVKLWDLRRMVLPITYFLEKPFQNWTRSSSNLLGTVMIYVDYEVPINDIREEGERIVNASPLWDKVAYGVQVTDWKNDVVEVRILVSSDSAPHLWDLRCELREKILLFLQQRETVFPRQRLTPLGAKGITLSGNGEQ